jgi:hypothetical protein
MRNICFKKYKYKKSIDKYMRNKQENKNKNKK